MIRWPGNSTMIMSHAMDKGEKGRGEDRTHSKKDVGKGMKK